MSPPNIDLNTKQISDAQGVPKPTDTKKCSKRRWCIITTIVVIVLLVVVATIFGGIAYNYHLFGKKDYDITPKIDGVDVPEHIHVDYNRKLILVKNDKRGRVLSIKTLFNYNRKLVAYLEEANKKCLVDFLPTSFDDDLRHWSSNANRKEAAPKAELIHSKRPIVTEVLYRIAGEEIADHCMNATSYWVTSFHSFTPEIRDKRQTGQLSFWIGMAKGKDNCF
ncbi:hypothetical protein SNE40_021667 [Patella caerulea]|uniref:Uncharacterized protein n=1 Tax=Patella caerulea TaxID=87958 RepID=A0AAN8J0P0_PATCE